MQTEIQKQPNTVSICGWKSSGSQEQKYASRKQTQ